MPRFAVLVASAAFVLGMLGAEARAQATGESGETQWIWSPAQTREHAPAPVCYFRKGFEVASPESAQLNITCDDRYELFVNGRFVGGGRNWKVLDAYDIRQLLRRGHNVVAVKADNTSGTTAGLVATLTVKDAGHTEISYSTDSTWKTSTQQFGGWERVFFNDSNWVAAHSLGDLGTAEPWADQVTGADGSKPKRFTLLRDFRIERVLTSAATGSTIAMAFNEWGEILLSREGGPLLLVIDRNKDGVPETVTTYCDQVSNCQGILPLNGEVYVMAQGPKGAAAIYRLIDDDRDGKADQVKTIVEFEPGMAEHGPHALSLGPDGYIYAIIGNHTRLKKLADAQSPYRRPYEGDLPQPKYEDSSGTAAGIKAPGGTIVRLAPDGGAVQIFAGGLRNAYDLAFNQRGDLFTYDSDMEWDVGLPWYRPTRAVLIPSGGELGWRSGWSVWPDYYLDNVQPIVNTGRGSPTGVEVYSHHAFPPEYREAMFAGDWSQGRILAIKLKPDGAGYTGRAEVFLQGSPLNVTDLAVGPEGGLYFCLGGRNTEGGVYRVVYSGRVQPPTMNTPIERALHQPQPTSAWGRQRLALLQQKIGDQWSATLNEAASDAALEASERCRALDLLQLYGPTPRSGMLIDLLSDSQADVRGKAAYLLGIHSDQTAGEPLARLLGDSEPAVRRMASEAIVRGGYSVPADQLIAALGDSDPLAAFAARRAIEEFPPEEWRSQVLKSANTRVFMVGSVALLIAEPTADDAKVIARRAHALMQKYLSDDDFIDLLRVIELAVVRGNLRATDVPELARALAKEYPAGEPRMNRELLRLLGQLDESSVIARLLGELKGSAPAVEKLHAAMMARFFKTGWTSAQKMTLVEFFEQARDTEGGNSFAGYVDNVSRDFLAGFTDAERQQLLAEAVRLPGAALSLLTTLPEHPSQDLIARLIKLDNQLRAVDTPAARKLQLGLVAVLGSSGDAGAMNHLREAFEREPDRRQELAMGLAQQPSGANWPLLLRSLPIVEGMAAQEVLMQLAGADRISNDPEALRQVLLCGLKLGGDGGEHAVRLLEKWSGKQLADAGAKPDVALAAWQKWFVREYPDVAPPTLAGDSETNRWSAADILAYLASPEGRQHHARQGAAVFEKAQCAKCHRYGGRGESIGPDLSTVGRRFHKKEILESILYPSQVISDQYASKTVTTTNGLSYTGIVTPLAGNKVLILQANGEKVTVPKSRIDEVLPSKKSAMPEGLLNSLTLEEIADLFAYLTGAN
ncbi:MAG TPA: HEAT repeat domain-containing protein [Pirellulales bacterium]|jgi:putative heme-binding domain-containing protein|nr:HEAT repeat domain-containing protein [Pirellulales bacterium]